MLAKDYRDLARASLGHKWLGNKWGNFAVIALIYILINAAGGATAYFGIGAIVLLIVSGPLEYGVAYTSIKVARGGEPQVNDLFEGFKDLGKPVLLYIINSIFVFLWSLLFIIPGIIKSIEYSMSYLILHDNPSLSANEARQQSMSLMKGNRWRYFCLMFSFIGWLLLCGLTAGILSFWVLPYMRTAQAHFYESLLPPAPAEPPVEPVAPPAEPVDPPAEPVDPPVIPADPFE